MWLPLFPAFVGDLKRVERKAIIMKQGFKIVISVIMMSNYILQAINISENIIMQN